jgi:hypothetical protein
LLLLSDELDGAHEPVLTSVMRGSEHLAMFSSHSLLYVTPSEPHTGDKIAGQANSQSALGHSPLDTTTSDALPDWHLAMFSSHSLLYVTPSEPHTGDRIAGQANSQSAVETVAIVANTARIIDGADLIVQEVGAVSVLIGWVGQRKRK